MLDDQDDDDEIFDDNKEQIEEHLEKVNDANIRLNDLRRQLETYDKDFNRCMDSAKKELTELRRKIGPKRIEKVTPYFKKQDEKRKAQEEAERAALLYHRSLSELETAKETLELALEGQNREAEQKYSSQEDLTWQEYLSLMKQKVVYAEQELERCRYEHQLHSKSFCAINDQLNALKKKHERSIEVSQPFFTLKRQREMELGEIQKRRNEIRVKLGSQKQAHKEAMNGLEAISSDMHMSRRLVSLQKRRHKGMSSCALDGASAMSVDGVSITLTCDSTSLQSDYDMLRGSRLVQCLASPAKGRIVSRSIQVNDHPLLLHQITEAPARPRSATEPPG